MSVENSFNSSSSQFSFEESDEYNNFKPTLPKIVLISLFNKNNLIEQGIKEQINSENFISNSIPELNQNNKRVLDVFNGNTQKPASSDIEAPQCKKKKLLRDDKRENFLSFWSRVREKFLKEIRSGIPKDNITDIYEWIKENSYQLEKIQSLNLCGLGLTDIPSEIKYLPFLCTLDASLNKITKIPEEVYNLTKLKILSLEDNKLEKISPSIKNLNLLEELILTKNVLEDLPDEIANLANLRILKLGDNYLKEVPKSFEGLGNLRELFLDSNELSDIPQYLTTLSNLKVLNLKNNCIPTVPVILIKLKELISIDLSGNNLEFNPNYKTEIYKLIFSLTNLQSFDY